MYLTYEDYQNMGGTLDNTAFNEYEFEAESIINWYTFNRLKNATTYPNELSRCMYALIKLCAEKAGLLGNSGVASEESGTGGSVITSQSNDGVSVSYNVISASEAFKLCSDEVGNTVKHYLSGVTNELGRKLLYRGLYPGE